MKKIIVMAFLLVAVSHANAQTTVSYDLIMRNVSTDTMWDGRVEKIYGFAPNILNAWLPGPTLIANEGEILDVFVWNISQGAPHTVHWHGMDVDQANDGVWHTSFAIGHMQDTNYIFAAQHAGTYMYHCHVHSVKHVQMGMYGPIIIHPADGSKRAWTGGPSYNQEKLWLTSELDSYWHDSLAYEPLMSPDTMHDEVQIPVYNPDYFLVNGLSETQLDSAKTAISAKEAERVYLRLINMGFYMNRYVFSSNLNATVLDSDGRPLPDSVRTDTLEVLPGERYGVMLTPTGRFDTVIQIDYVEVFNLSVKNTQYVPVHVQGHIAIDPPVDILGLKVFPNPADGWINISWENAESRPQTLKLIDPLGRVILAPELRPQISAVQSIDISSLPDGLYFLESETKEKREVFKILIRHKD
jgi:FtsP/CotA-like multicopper oxidase with cupredoxin domain